VAFFDKYKYVDVVPKKAAKRLSFAERVSASIKEQKQIANGAEVLTPKGNPKKSWYDSETNSVKVMIGILPLFEKPIKCSSEKEYKELLNDLTDWQTDKGLNPLFDSVEKKQKEIADQKAKTLASKKG